MPPNLVDQLGVIKQTLMNCVEAIGVLQIAVLPVSEPVAPARGGTLGLLPAGWVEKALAVEKMDGVPACFLLAVAAHESDWGKSAVWEKLHNPFGINGAGPAGFQVFDDFGDACEHESNGFVARFKRWPEYAAARAIYSSDGLSDAFFETWGKTYAQDPKWAEQVMAKARRFEEQLAS